MIREVNLIQYLPPKVQAYYEMQKITAAENPEFQMLWDVNEQIRNNIFILTATEEGLTRFERIIGLFPAESDSFETRRTRILSWWNNEPPYTIRYLLGMLNIITGGNFEVITDFDEYELEITTYIGEQGVIDELLNLINTVIPANLVVNSKNKLDVVTSGNMRISAILIQSSVFMITNDFEAVYAVNGQMNTGSNMAVTSELFVTNDFEADVSIESSAIVGGATVIVTEYQI